MRPETETAIRAAKFAQEIADSRAGADQIISKGGIDLATAADSRVKTLFEKNWHVPSRTIRLLARSAAESL